MGQLVFGIGIDRVLGLDSETGQPIWRRSVGSNPPFQPIIVEAAEPGILVYHTGVRELMMLSQATGKLIWRQSIPGRPGGPPLIEDGQIYVTTTSGDARSVGRTPRRIHWVRVVVS